MKEQYNLKGFIVGNEHSLEGWAVQSLERPNSSLILKISQLQQNQETQRPSSKATDQEAATFQFKGSLAGDFSYLEKSSPFCLFGPSTD